MYLDTNHPFWEKSVLVLYDLEYSGNLKDNLGRNCCIWEIYAKHGDKTFYTLINPHLTRKNVPPPVDERYKMPTKEEFKNLNAVSFIDAIKLFIVFLNSLLIAEDQSIILASHNGFRGDKVVMEHELINHRIYEDMLTLPIHFFDTLYFVRHALPNEPSYSISKLYESLFKEKIKNVHTAKSDVEALQRIIDKINQPLEGCLFMLYLTPFSNVNGIGKFIQNNFFNAGFTSLEHFFYLIGMDLSNINQALIIHNIIVDNIFKVNHIAFEMHKYATTKLIM